MKTNTNKNQNAKAQSRPEQLSTDNRPKINFKRRFANRALDTQKLLTLLGNEFPNFFKLAEVVGKWVWIQFEGKQPVEIISTLSELGFHWNNTRQAWQHPCGTITDRRIMTRASVTAAISPPPKPPERSHDHANGNDSPRLGYKQSGLGRLNGVTAMDDFIEYKTIVHKIGLKAA